MILHARARRSQSISTSWISSSARSIANKRSGQHSISRTCSRDTDSLQITPDSRSILMRRIISSRVISTRSSSSQA